MKIALVATGLGQGGAEAQVVALADWYANHGHKVLLIGLTGETLVYPVSKQVKLIALIMKKTPFGFFVAYRQAALQLIEFQAEVVHSHMVHANIFCRLLRLCIAMPRLVCTAHNQNEGGRWRMLAYRLTDRLASISTNVSQDAVDAFQQKGAVNYEVFPLLCPICGGHMRITSLHHLQRRHPANTGPHRGGCRATAHHPGTRAAAVGWLRCAGGRWCRGCRR